MRSNRPVWIVVPFLLVALGMPSCGDDASAREHALPPLDRLPKDPAGDSVRQALTVAGGWQTWDAKRTVRYRKTTERLDPSGAPIDALTQLHRYVLKPHLKIRIDWVQDGHDIALVNDGEHAWKIRNGKVMTERMDFDEAMDSAYGSHYVFGMPFKLTDPGARMTAVEPRELEPGLRTAAGVRVIYEPWAGRSGGQHIWTYWFDELGLLAANDYQRVAEPSEHLLSRYYDFVTVQGLKMPTKRLAWRFTDEAPQLVPATSITYADMVFDAVFPEDLFARPDGR
ncbi:MAG: hypothetical protein ABIP94_06250 [Planctomycetota bacterium]